MKEVIKIEKLSKEYNGFYAVNQINISIKKGEIIGLLGVNGAGKTTAIKMLLNMIKPSSGGCWIMGNKVNSKNLDFWNSVGYIVDAPHAYPELTVRENLEIVFKLRGLKNKEEISRMMHQLNLQEYEYRKVKHLSLGNVQRLGIAKALIHHPEVLILDEPTNGLDPKGVVEVRELLKNLSKNYGVTILISSHKLEEIARLVTRSVIIHEGKLIKSLDMNDLDRDLNTSLVIGGKYQKEMRAVLKRGGYQVTGLDRGNGVDSACLEIRDEATVKHPETVVTLLVNAGCPPRLLKVEKEDLEHYFLRTIKKEAD